MSLRDVDVGRLLLSRETLFLDLYGRKVDVEVLLEPVTRLMQRPVTILSNASHADMSGENIAAGGEAPSVDMMDVVDALNASHGSDCALKVEAEAFRSALQEDPQGGADDAPRGPEQHEAEGHAKKGVNRKKTGKANHERRNDDDQTTDEGLDDVPERPLMFRLAFWRS